LLLKSYGLKTELKGVEGMIWSSRSVYDGYSRLTGQIVSEVERNGGRRELAGCQGALTSSSNHCDLEI
jgi:hypothetical protein